MGFQFLACHELDQIINHIAADLHVTTTKLITLYLNAVKQVQFIHKEQDVKGEHFCQEILKDVL